MSEPVLTVGEYDRLVDSVLTAFDKMVEALPPRFALEAARSVRDSIIDHIEEMEGE